MSRMWAKAVARGSGAGLFGLILLVCFAASGGPARGADEVVGDPMVGMGKAGVCAGCHGVDGNSMVTSWPKLAAQQPNYIVKQLHDFKSGARRDPMMGGVAAGLTDQDMADIAAWFASQTVKPGPGAGDVVSGERLYFGGNLGAGVVPCVGCHGPTAAGHPGMGKGGFPSLRGQHSAYTTKQLLDFIAGTRKNDQGGMMSHIAERLTLEEINALAAFLEQID